MSFTYDPFKTHRWFKSKNDAELKSANLDTFLKEVFIEMTLDHETKPKYTFKGTRYYRMNEETVGKISQALCNCWAHFTSFSKFVQGGIWV